MKHTKILLLAVLLFGITSLQAQKEPIREVLNYQGENDKAMIKAKTDLFLLDVLSSGKFEVKTNSQGDDHLDVDLLTPFSDGKISARVRYDFLNEGYVVSLSNAKIIGKNGKEALLNNPSNKDHQRIIDSFKKLVFTTYKAQLNK